MRRTARFPPCGRVLATARYKKKKKKEKRKQNEPDIVFFFLNDRINYFLFDIATRHGAMMLSSWLQLPHITLIGNIPDIMLERNTES